jgi:ankyrin repeat protein
MRTRARRGWWIVSLLALTGIGAAGARDTRLLDAARSADAPAVQALLRDHADANVAEVDGTTPLHWAVHRDNAALVNLLIAAGAKVDARNRYGVTPLSLACENGNAGIADALLSAGANPNATTADGETALMTAARTGNPEAVTRLLARGADVNAKETWRGQTALMWATAEKHAAVVETLIGARADIHAKTMNGFNAFLFAVRGGDFGIVRTLLNAGAKVNEPGGDGTTPLILAIVNAHYELAAFLLDQGADPNLDAPGGTALHALVRTRNYEYGKVVRPPAVRTGRLDAMDLAQALVDHGAEPNAQIVKALPRQGGFDNNYLKLIGATPFLLAAKAADPTMMRFLVEHGAEPAIPTKEHVTPLMVAAGAGYVQGQSLEGERFAAVRYLVDLGADVDALSDSGESVMHGAATGGVNDVVRLLAARGAKLDVKSKDGFTPLQVADGTKSAFRAWPETAALFRQLLGETKK